MHRQRQDLERHRLRLRGRKRLTRLNGHARGGLRAASFSQGNQDSIFQTTKSQGYSFRKSSENDLDQTINQVLISAGPIAGGKPVAKWWGQCDLNNIWKGSPCADRLGLTASSLAP